MFAHLLFVDLVHGPEVAEVLQVDRGLDHVLEGAAAGLEHRFEVLEDLADLGVEAGHQLAGLGVEADLAGGVEPAVDRDRLGVGADRGGGVVAVDVFHIGSPDQSWLSAW